MAVKSVLEIDVQDDQFKAFFELFEKYNSQLEGMSKKWEEVAAAGKKVKKSTEKISAKPLGDSLKQSTKDMKKLSDAVDDTDKNMRRVKKSTKDVSNEIFNLNKGMAKIFGGYGDSTSSSFGTLGKIAGIITGIALAGVYALSKLGDVAVKSQRQARSNNMTSGQVRAFESDFSRLSDSSIIDKITAAKYDPEQQVYLRMASGMKSIEEVQKASPVELASKIMSNAHDFMVSLPPGLRNSATASAKGFTQLGFSAQDMNLFMNTPMAEHQKALRDYNADKKDLNISDKSTGKFFEMNRQIDVAEKKIVSTLIYKLDDSSEAVGKFTKSLSDAAEKILSLFKTPDSNAPHAWESNLPDQLQYLRRPVIDPATQSSINKVFNYSFTPGSQNRSAPTNNKVNLSIFNSTGSNIATSVNGASV